MNKIYIFIGLIGLVLVGSFIFLNSQQKLSSDEVMKKEVDLTGEKKLESQTAKTSRYVEYSKSAFAESADKKRVIYFHANWCPICRPTDEEFMRRASDIPDDVVVFKTDYDIETELKKKYAVTYQHTFVQVDKEGNEVTKWNGGVVDELIAKVK